MTRIILRIVCVLLVLHGVTAFVAAKFLPISAIGDRLLFAQHGFAFIFLSLLNFAVYDRAPQQGLMRWCVQISNLTFFLFYVAISIRNPEPPNLISSALVGALFVIGLALGR